VTRRRYPGPVTDDEPAPRFRDHPVSFVRRSGRMSDGQERAWAELSARYLLPVPRDLAATSVAHGSQVEVATVYGRSAPLVVEVGSGQGHAIVHAAASRPDVDFLAVEVFKAGLARTMRDADLAGVGNLRLVEANAPEVLEHLLPATDWEDYALQMRDVMDAAPAFARAFPGEWAPRFEGRVLTAFERKGVAKGRSIRDLAYRRE